MPGARGKRRKALRPVWRDGQWWCVVGVDHPNDPEHPRSPYCVTHRTQARNGTYKRSREAGQQAVAIMDVVIDPRGHRFEDGAYVGPRGIAVLPERAAGARAALGEFLSALDAVKTNTNDLKPGRDADYYLAELQHLADAASLLNAALGPLLYGRRVTPPR